MNKTFTDLGIYPIKILNKDDLETKVAHIIYR